MTTTPYTLRDLEHENYRLPPRAELDHLQPGEIVKLGFCPKVVIQIETEWMWVVVVARTDNGYLGNLDSEPTCVPGLVRGDAVRFAPENVLEVYHAEQVH